MFCSLLRCHLPELPLSRLGRSGGTGNFGGFTHRLSYHNFNHVNILILGILQRLFSTSQHDKEVLCFISEEIVKLRLLS